MTLDDSRYNATIADILRENAYARSNAPAVSEGERRLSWAQLQDAALSACARFSALGVQRGDRVAVVLGNQLDCVVLYWACALSGAIFVGANPRLGHDELRNILAHSGASVAFVGGEATAQRVREMAVSTLREVLAIDGADTADRPALRSGAPIATPQGSRDDVFAICYTSGTTGRPKGALLTHGNLVWNAATVAEVLQCTERDAFLLAVGITHIFGLSAGILAAAICGARTVLLKSYAAGAALDLCERERVSVHHGTPTMFVLELAAQRRAPRDLSSLRTGIVAAAPVRPDLADHIRDELHCDVQIGWGLTETAPAVTMTRFDDPPQQRRTSVGRAISGARISTADEGHEYGEVLVKSPGVFRGYYNDRDLTQRAFTEDGWFRTGDLGTIDDDGFLYVKGRRKEIVIRGGLHVYPDEVEAVLLELPWIEAVALVGIPDAVMGERTCACIVVDPAGHPPGNMLAAVREAVANRLADYNLPDAILRIADLPRAPGGKVLKGVLREDAIARVGSE